MAFTHFKGIQEMGLICGGGLLLCFVPMMTLLPVLLLRGRQNVMDHQTTEDETRARIENIWLQRPVLVTGDHRGTLFVGAGAGPEGLFRLQFAEIAERRIAVGGL
jgi:predicted RND superfamily exporter protein